MDDSRFPTGFAAGSVGAQTPLRRQAPGDVLGKGLLPTRAKGGPVKKNRDYLVGERGMEKFVPKMGEAKMVGKNGPEVRKFSKNGKIISNKKLPKWAEPKGY